MYLILCIDRSAALLNLFLSPSNHCEVDNQIANLQQMYSTENFRNLQILCWARRVANMAPSTRNQLLSPETLPQVPRFPAIGSSLTPCMLCEAWLQAFARCLTALKSHLPRIFPSCKWKISDWRKYISYYSCFRYHAVSFNLIPTSHICASPGKALHRRVDLWIRIIHVIQDQQGWRYADLLRLVDQLSPSTVHAALLFRRIPRYTLKTPFHIIRHVISPICRQRQTTDFIVVQWSSYSPKLARLAYFFQIISLRIRTSFPFRYDFLVSDDAPLPVPLIKD